MTSKAKVKKDPPFDWSAFDALTDDQVMAAAKADPDAQPMTKAQLARMKRATPVRRVRFGLGLTQEQFSRTFHIPIATLRAWERGETEPDALARAYLTAIAGAADAISTALARKPVVPA